MCIQVPVYVSVQKFNYYTRPKTNVIYTWLAIVIMQSEIIIQEHKIIVEMVLSIHCYRMCEIFLHIKNNDQVIKFQPPK